MLPALNQGRQLGPTLLGCRARRQPQLEERLSHRIDVQWRLSMAECPSSRAHSYMENVVGEVVSDLVLAFLDAQHAVGDT